MTASVPEFSPRVLTGIVAGLAAGALWGLVFIAPRMVGTFSAVDLTAGRFFSYGAFSLSLLAFARRSARPDLKQALAALGMSLLGFTAYYLLLVLAIQDAGVEIPSVIIGTIPVWMMLLGRPAGLRFGRLVPGLLLTLAGLVLMIWASGGLLAQGDGMQLPRFWRGVVLATASMLCWTAFGLLNATWLKTHLEVSAMTWANWLGVATGTSATLLWLFAGTDASVLRASPDLAGAVVLCVATGIGSAWLATVLWNVASQRLSASLCGQLIVSETLFALFYAFVWDARWPTALQGLACTLFVTGILASIRAHR